MSINDDMNLSSFLKKKKESFIINIRQIDSAKEKKKNKKGERETLVNQVIINLFFIDKNY